MLIKLTTIVKLKLITQEHLLPPQIYIQPRIAEIDIKKKKSHATLYLSSTWPLRSAWSMLSRRSL